jgi:molybdopterin synthase catalytic subunit
MISTGLWHEPQEPYAALAAFAASQPEAVSGAAAVFVGTMRSRDPQDSSQTSIVGMWLEHYPRMTGLQLESLARAVRHRHGLHAVLLQHRVGMVYPGETLVVIGTWAAHREAAWTGCREILETVKTGVALWKKEFLANGSSRWVQAEGDRMSLAAMLRHEQQGGADLRLTEMEHIDHSKEKRGGRGVS